MGWSSTNFRSCDSCILSRSHIHLERINLVPSLHPIHRRNCRNIIWNHRLTLVINRINLRFNSSDCNPHRCSIYTSICCRMVINHLRLRYSNRFSPNITPNLNHNNWSCLSLNRLELNQIRICYIYRCLWRNSCRRTRLIIHCTNTSLNNYRRWNCNSLGIINFWIHNWISISNNRCSNNSCRLVNSCHSLICHRRLGFISLRIRINSCQLLSHSWRSWIIIITISLNNHRSYRSLVTNRWYLWICHWNSRCTNISTNYLSLNNHFICCLILVIISINLWINHC